MDLALKGKTAVITGGASGLGRETAKYLVGEGARVLIADRHEENLGQVEHELEELGGEASTIRVDVTRYEDCQRMAEMAMEDYGGIDVLVAGAGVSTSNDFFLQTSPDDWDAMLEVNVRGVLNTNRAVAPFMVERGSGSIINLASEAGKVGEKRIVVYSATKGAVMSFTKAFSLEMGRFHVRVNAVCPGVTRTPMTERFGKPGDELYDKSAAFYPLGRLGEPQDIASMITFLASDQSSWITGQCISVSGGFGRS